MIAARVGGLSEIVARSRGTILGVPPKDPVKLAAAVESLLLDRPRAGEIGDRGRDHVLKTYSWANVARAVSRLLTKMPSGAGPEALEVAHAALQ